MNGWVEDYVRGYDGVRLRYSVQGHGEPALVLCDGLACDGFAWKYLKPELSPHHRIIHPHYRGHGLSGMPEDHSHFNIPDFARDILSVMDAAKLRKSVLIGHSMGVQVCLEFHRLYPDRVLGLILCCGPFETPLHTFQGTHLAELAFPFVKRVGLRFHKPLAALARQVFPTSLAYHATLMSEANPNLVKREDIMPYFDHLARMDPRAFFRSLEGAQKHSARDHLPEVDAPTLIIAAEQDKFTPLALSEEMHQSIRNSEMLILPGGSHVAPVEFPELMNLRITEFLRRHFGGMRAKLQHLHAHGVQKPGARDSD
ncbi:MAG: Tropinesterase [Myxococcota bacterium]|nr:Tropinesterase [Myxococcota bacterium]